MKTKILNIHGANGLWVEEHVLLYQQEEHGSSWRHVGGFMGEIREFPSIKYESESGWLEKDTLNCKH